MSGAIEMKAYVVGGLVSAQTVTELLVFGEPMLTDTPSDVFRYRAWLRLRSGGRTFGYPAPTVRLAAENLMAKVRAERC